MSTSIFNLTDRPSVEVSCNWDANMQDKSIEDTVMVSFHKDNSDECENFSDVMDVRTTVNFVKPDNSHEKPVIKFRIPGTEDVYISAITILCDNKTLEVFGDHNIYTDTVYGETIEETQGFCVYENKVDFGNKINKEVSLKLVKMIHVDYFWVYGILLKLKKINVESKSTSTINYENVEELMKNSNISDEASKAFSFLRDANMSQRFMTPKGDSSSPEKKQDLQTSLSEIRQYIDYKFQILTDFLILRERNVNDKLDRIIELMKSKN